MAQLHEKACEPCRGDTPRLASDEVSSLLADLSGWTVVEQRLLKSVVFSNFVKAMEFVNAMADLAEAEGHHPDFSVHWNRVEISVWTHAIGGLSENDFILAAKINEVCRQQ